MHHCIYNMPLKNYVQSTIHQYWTRHYDSNVLKISKEYLWKVMVHAWSPIKVVRKHVSHLQFTWMSLNNEKNNNNKTTYKKYQVIYMNVTLAMNNTLPSYTAGNYILSTVRDPLNTSVLLLFSRIFTCCRSDDNSCTTTNNNNTVTTVARF